MVLGKGKMKTTKEKMEFFFFFFFAKKKKKIENASNFEAGDTITAKKDHHRDVEHVVFGFRNNGRMLPPSSN
jgi:hypothetical protein